MNYKLLIQYDGTDFHGWQVQRKKRTVQGELQRVLSLLNDAETHVAGSGRTDAGVHAAGQTASVRMQKDFAPDKLRAAINANLPHDLRVMNAEIAPDNFHARFSATGKTYVYRIVNAPVISPFAVRYAKHETRPLDVAPMREAAQIFLGEHDWTAFSAAQTDAETRVRTITESVVTLGIDGETIEFRVTGNGFLRYMVRSLAGTLLAVGRGEKDFDTIRKALTSGDRRLSGATAAAHGLTLLHVFYE